METHVNTLAILDILEILQSHVVMILMVMELVISVIQHAQVFVFTVQDESIYFKK